MNNEIGMVDLELYNLFKMYTYLYIYIDDYTYVGVTL